MASNDSLKIIIIDDELHNVAQLIELLNAFDFDYEVLGVGLDKKKGLQLLLTLTPDLVFLDMKLPDGEGIEILESIPPFSFHVIFFTAHETYALQAFKWASIDYLLKPIDLKSLSRALKRFMVQKNKPVLAEKQKRSENRIAIPHKQGTLYLAPHEIIYIQAYGEYCYFVTEKKRLLISRTLKDVESVIGNEQFVRIHRSFIVNITRIKYFQQKGKPSVILSNNEELEVSRRKKEMLVKAIESRVTSI